VQLPSSFRQIGSPARFGALAAIVIAFTATLVPTRVSLGAESPAAPSLDLAPHRGRVVIVDFWASWCKPCRQSSPWLNSLRTRYGPSGLTIIGVNVDADRHDAERFLRDVPIDFEVLFDPDGNIARQFKVKAMPMSYVIDRSGKLVETHMGFREAKEAETEASIKALLDAPAH
jgi:thiol-disulfide isomerase/thioredoxin